MIDKNSGLLSIDKINVPWTFENVNLKFIDDDWLVVHKDSDSLLENPDAWLVLEKHFIGGSKKNISRPSSPLSAEWTVRVKILEDDKTSIKINRIYAKSYSTYSTRYDKYVDEKTWKAYSTGVMEKN